MKSTPVADSSRMQPTADRPVPFRCRRDLVVTVVWYQGRPYRVIKDPVSLTYHRLTESQFFLLEHLDGMRSTAELKELLQRKFPQTFWTNRELQMLIADLHAKRLAVSDRPGQGRHIIDARRKETWDRTRQTLASFLFLRFPGIEPTALLNVLYPLVRWVYHPFVVSCVLAAVVGSLVWCGVYFDDFRRELPSYSQFFSGPNLVSLWLVLGVTKVLHELGHALTCRHFGGECHSIGVMLLVFNPTLYCDVTDSWMMPNKWHRIWIAAAGMFVEMALSVVAVAVWWNTQPGVVHQLALNVFFVTTVTTAVFNANPLLRLDGYYILSDLAEVPNLSQKAQQALWDGFGRICLGIEPTPDPFEPRQQAPWLLVYAVASAAYRIALMVTIGVFLYTVLKPYRLESLGATAAIASIAGMVTGVFWKAIQLIRKPREEPLSRVRIGFTLGLLAAAAIALLLVPVPIYVEAPFTLQPRGARHLYNALPGTLDEVLVRPGERVAAGQVLARFSNEDLSDRRRQLELDRQRQAAQERTFHALGSAAEEALAKQRLASLEEQLAVLDAQLELLTIRAPVAGTFVEPPSQPETTAHEALTQLPRWSGAPFDESNRGISLEPRTLLGSIAPSSEFEAVILIDQADRDELRPGDSIRLRLDHLPDSTFDGVIVEIASREQQFSPPQLAGKYGGTLATTTDDQGRERLNSLAYEAIVAVDLPEQQVETGNRGRARKLLTHRPLAVWIYRWLREALYFRL